MGWGGSILPLLWVVYKDDHVVLVDKPEGLITVGAKREDMRNVLHFILCPLALVISCRCRCRCLSRKTTGPLLPRPVHRLDLRTSGLVVVSETDRATTALSWSFADWFVRKLYITLIFGPDDDGDGNLVPSLAIYIYPSNTTTLRRQHTSIRVMVV